MTALPLFVYGTLRHGASHAGLLGAARRRSASTRGTLWRMPAGYPALDPAGDGVVHGELCEPVPESVLRVLDAYEGVDEGLYRRSRLAVDPGEGHLVLAWAWVMRDPGRRGGLPVRSGRWHPAPRPADAD